MHPRFFPPLLLAALVALVARAGATSPDGDQHPHDREPASAAIRKLLADQVGAWNAGDIPGFMAAYEKSETLRFASGGSITLGWQPTLERYLKRYPDKAAMGTLGFTVHDVDLVAADAAVVFGRWELVRAADRPWGLFTLVMKKRAEGWRIVSDHTSSAD